MAEPPKLNMVDSANVFLRVTQQLSKMAAPNNRMLPISYDTEIYRDLKIYGDDFFELILWIDREFGIEFNFDLARHAPGEMPFFSVLEMLKRIFGIPQRQYKSFKVHDIITAIDAGRWSDEARVDRT